MILTLQVLDMGFIRALPLSSSSSSSSSHHLFCSPTPVLGKNRICRGSFRRREVSAKLQGDDDDDDGGGKKMEEKKKKGSSNKNKQSLFGSVTEALDFSKVRSEEDAMLLDEAREATTSGGRMTREQYGALRRKIGGTYKDFFKSYVEVDGQYVEEGWVDKTCKICKKDTKGEARQVDNLGRYVHVACVEKKATSGNFFTRLFSR